jgi:hypothetical protein
MLENNSYVCAFAYLPTYVKTSQSTMYCYTANRMNLLYVGFTHFQIVKDLSNKALIGLFALKLNLSVFAIEALFCTHLLVNQCFIVLITGGE